VRLYHATDDGPAILREGFTRCDIHEGAKVAWLSAQRDRVGAGRGRNHLVVVVDLPDELVRPYVYRVNGAAIDPNLFCLPHDVINAYRSTFTLEPGPEAQPPPDP
jgi:hypothetical protein